VSGKRELLPDRAADGLIVVKSVPASCYRKLQAAERRLEGAIAHDEPRPTLVAAAERVRRAQLGVIKARARAASMPTELDDAPRTQHLANLEASARSWQLMPADELVARYAARSTEPR
jgi:hypothetical protein